MQTGASSKRVQGAYLEMLKAEKDYAKIVAVCRTALDVDNFDEKTILLYTQMGELSVTGKNLHVNSMSIETGEMTIEGDIYSLVYGDKDKHNPMSFFGRLFR